MLTSSFKLLKENSLKYKSPKNKILSLERQGKIFKVIKGLYETDNKVSPLYLSSSIYGPSYISFETALSYWDLIPERVSTIMAATFKKNRSKTFKSDFGTFLYRDIPANAFPYEVYIQNDLDHPFLLAGKEKALCDTVYNQIPLRSEKQLKNFLFENLRIEENAFKSLNLNLLCELCNFYKSTNLKILSNFVKKLLQEV